MRHLIRLTESEPADWDDPDPETLDAALCDSRPLPEDLEPFRNLIRSEQT